MQFPVFTTHGENNSGCVLQPVGVDIIYIMHIVSGSTPQCLQPLSFIQLVDSCYSLLRVQKVVLVLKVLKVLKAI